MKPSENAENLIAQFEGLRTTAYADQRGIPTIGYGHTQGVKMGDICTEEQAGLWLLEDLDAAAKWISAHTANLTQNEFDALCSLVFNIGVGHFSTSTLLRNLNIGEKEIAADQFLVWDMTGGKVNPGLLRRRQAERALFVKEGA